MIICSLFKRGRFDDQQILSMRRRLFFLLCILASCNDKLYDNEVVRTQFCKYFRLQEYPIKVKGKTVISYAPEVSEKGSSKVLSFVKRHEKRFEYLLMKTFTQVIDVKDSISIKERFCNRLSTDSFYSAFILLTSGKELSGVQFKPVVSETDVIKIASRFFLCDSVRQSDTIIFTKICIGINGVSTLPVFEHATVLEAFCFEAIFNNRKKLNKLVSRFSKYAGLISSNNLKNFDGFEEHLGLVKDSSYLLMEKDSFLIEVLRKHYENNTDNIGFIIQ